MDEDTFFLGIAFGLGIISIPSPKDIFFIKMCVLRRGLLSMAFVAVASDAFLIAAGALLFGMTSEISAVGMSIRVLAVFYIVYLFLSIDRKGLSVDAVGSDRLRGDFLRMGELSLANPYSWIDTVVFLGGMAAVSTHPVSFISGAIVASVIWFVALMFVFGWLLSESMRESVYKYLPMFAKIILPIILCVLVIEIYSILKEP
ncbi:MULTISPECIES: LysE family transporter [Delftia]|uniref:LysE/ArgO family amino acid transporter n=1 Tax=Delftia TaxID=80865 RepID=UPI0009292003|nr:MULTISPECIES: LysE family transporter [Delftia]MDH0421753.1 LysE family transporter [Delftia tsuruhatensis]OJX12725.1 MAG: hypothetical protein BGO79_06215 [Delftia sp. 67-8]QFS66058.1 hypothetical protein GCS91_17880 [Delftia tsuruhatensis]WON87651.1 LysE family transporter [Delftia sp. UGAL515B_04]